MHIIREMRSSDIPDVLRIENQVFRPPWPEEGFQEAPSTWSWVICDSDVLKGYILYHVVLDEGVIINFAIDPACQKQGLGSELLSYTMDILIKRCVSTFFLDVRESNQAARGLYQKFGFEPLGVRKNYYTQPVEDAIVMVRHTVER
jgi:ribosomal-protein-alanine N-acetyltransferase